MFEMAGVVGVSPYDFSFRELQWMAQGRWDEPALLCCVFANSQRDPKKRPIEMEEFHPYREKRRRKTTSLTPEKLRAFKPHFAKPDGG